MAVDGSHVLSLQLFNGNPNVLNAGATAATAATVGAAAVQVTAAAPASLRLSPNAITVASGVPLVLTAGAYDAFGNLAPGYLGTVHLTTSDTSATLPADFSLPTGNANTPTPLVLVSAGNQNVTATAAGLISGQATFSVVGGGPLVSTAPAVRLALSLSPNATAGQAFSVTATALDANGQLAPSYAGTIIFSSSDANALLPSGLAFNGGTVTLPAAVMLKSVGTQTVTLADANGSILASQQNVWVMAGAATKLTVLAGSSTLVAGQSSPVVVRALDAFGNTCPTYQGTIHLTSSDANATLPANAFFTVGDSGLKTLNGNLILVTAGTMQLAAADIVTSSIAGQTNIAVVPAALAGLRLVGATTTTAGLALPLVVSPIDVLGNIVTSYVGTLHVTSTDLQARLPTDRVFASSDAGIVVLNAVLTTVGNQNITVADSANSNIVSTLRGIGVGAAAPARLAMRLPTVISAGSSLSSTIIRVEDAFGNLAPTFAG